MNESNERIRLSTNEPSGPAETSPDLQRYCLWGIVLGAFLVGIGILSLLAAGLATQTVVLFLGWMLLFGGIAQAVHAFVSRGSGEGAFHFLIGALYVLGGFVLLSWPNLGALSLTMVLASFFLATGIFRALWAASVRPPKWSWVLISGLLTTMMGVLVWATFPDSALWFLGTLVGVEMIVSGWSLLVISSAARHLVVDKTTALKPAA